MITMIIKNAESILTELYKSKSRKGELIRNIKDDPPYAIEIGEVENRILLIEEPGTNLVQWVITMFRKEGLADIYYDTICLTTAGREFARKLIETL